MGIEEIRASGLLELYVMDQLSAAEKAEVESYLITYPQLKQDVAEIEKSLEVFATSASVVAPPGLKERILDQIRKDTKPKGSGTKPPGSNAFGLISILLGLGLLIFGYLFWQKGRDLEQLKQEIILLRDSCLQTTQQLNEQLQILQQLTFPDNRILPFQATPDFATTDLYLHHNPVTQRNFIQVRNLPPLASNQTYQLWSLKPDQAPAPLDVFDVPPGRLIEVRYVEGTQTYAITIEPAGGRDTPTLENLIGTVSVGGI